MQMGKHGQEQVGGLGWGAAPACRGLCWTYPKLPWGAMVTRYMGLSWREKALDTVMEHSSSYYSYDLFTLSVG